MSRQSEQFGGSDNIGHLGSFPGANPARDTVEVTIEGTDELIEVTPSNDLTVDEIKEMVDVRIPGTVELEATDEEGVLEVSHDGRIDVGSRTDRNLGYVEVREVTDSVATEDADRDDLEATIAADDELVMAGSALGATDLLGRIECSGSYSVEVRWLDEAGDVQFTETVADAVEGGTVTELEERLASPDVEVALIDASGAENAANGVLHLT